MPEMDTEAKLNAEFNDWFGQLQALSDEQLVPEDWTERWFDGYSPKAALEAGPENDE